MGYDEEYIHSLDGLNLRTALWQAEEPKAVVAIVHGLGEHLGRFEKMANYLVESGFSVAAMDLRGHGKSEGIKGHAPSIDLLLGDIEELLKMVRREYNSLPIILYGHSMGGNLVTHYILRKPINELAAFIASSAWLATSFPPPKWKLTLGKFFARVLPVFRQDTGLVPEHISRIPEEVEKYKTDPLIHSQLSAGLFDIVTSSAGYIQENIDKCELTGLAFHGDDDRIISHDVNHSVYQKSRNIKWKTWPGSYHEPHNDKEKEEVYAYVTEWIQSTI